MLATYAQHYEELWKMHWWWQARRRFVLRLVRGISRQKKLNHILDIGCGNGLFFDDLSQFGSVRGIEPDAALVPAQSKWQQAIDIRRFDATFMPPQPVDLVLMLDVLEHIEDDAAAVAAVREILSPGGHYIITVPALMSLWSMHDIANQHFRRYRKAQLRTLLQTAGFEVLRIGYFFGWSVGPMLLRRILSPGGGANVDPANYEVKIPPGPVNAMMYGMTRLEQMTTGGWLPVGSSVFAVARCA